MRDQEGEMVGSVCADVKEDGGLVYIGPLAVKPDCQVST